MNLTLETLFSIWSSLIHEHTPAHHTRMQGQLTNDSWRGAKTKLLAQVIG